MTTPSRAVQSAWVLQDRWSRVADRVRADLDRWRWVNLALLVSGAVLGALAAQRGWLRAVTGTAAGVAAFSLAVAGTVQRRYLTDEQVQRWTGARAASETVKSEVYRYLVGVAPYDGLDRDRVLVTALDEAQERAAPLVLDLEQTPAADVVLPEVRDLESYVVHRAREQEAWHSRKIPGLVRTARRIRTAELVATLLAALLAALGAGLDVAGPSVWVGVATTSGAAFTAHLNATQSDRIAAGYAATAERLRRLVEQLPPDPGPAEVAAFVSAVEARLAAQTEGWTGLFSGR